MKSRRVIFLRRLVRNKDILLVIVLMLVLVSIIDYDDDYEQEQESLFEAATLPSANLSRLRQHPMVRHVQAVSQDVPACHFHLIPWSDRLRIGR